MIPRMKNAVFVLLVCLTASSAAFGISSSEASEKARAYLGEAEPGIKSLSQPLEVGVDRYWVFFKSVYAPVTTDKLLVAISDFDGKVVEDEEKLREIGEALYKYGVLEEFVKKNGYSFEVLEPTARNAVSILQQNEAKLGDLRAQTEPKYSFLSFEELELNLTLLSEEAIDLNTLLEDGRTQQQIFEQEYTAYALNDLFYYYNLSFDALAQFFDSFDAYSQSISDLQSVVYRSTIPDPDNKNIYSNLEALRDIGVSALYSKFRSSDPRLSMERLMGDSDAWVNDSIESFLYRKTRVDALQAYNELKPLVENVFAAKQSIIRCPGLNAKVSQLEKKWADIEYYKSKAGTQAYARIVELAPETRSLVQSIEQGFDECTTPTETPEEKDEWDFTPILYLLLVVVVGYGAFKYYQSKRMQQEQETE